METISRGKGREILSKLFQSAKSGLRKQKKSCQRTREEHVLDVKRNGATY